MTLDIGNVERITDPSVEQVRYFLRFMPPEAPFIILTASEGFFMQAVPAEKGYRIEYRQNKRQYFTKLPYEKAADLLELFRSGDDSFRTAISWRRLGFLNDPYAPASLLAVILLLLLIIAAEIWPYIM